ncbi:gpW family head-tail joining protein [Marinobacter sp. DS40M6]|uniref:gpW family head-tail joining protein n=1 Tax=Marinobacter sp. DS40M6 TaxID=1597776 RepID=UPI002359A110|nr:gpW family head-tail joining protein [Marinobacter sp. DS40M6]MDC8455329.1 gpW family protein [Marinobacter sp. DS40M6]
MSLETQLLEAREAYHNLLTGQAVVRIERNGRMVEFSQASKRDLAAYIASLESQLGGAGRRRGPARFIL